MTPPRTKEAGRHVESVLKALDILDCFHVQSSQNLKQIIEKTGLNRSRVIRLTGTLESRGYLTYDSRNRQFQLGSRVMTLGKIFELNNNLITLSRPVLKDLVQKTGEMASLYVLDGYERVVIAREPGIHPIGYTLIEGERMEIYAGAAGKLLLAYASDDIMNHVVRKRFLKKLTTQTIAEPERLLIELKTIKQQGYAVSKGERAEDAASVAVPVFEYQNRICAAIGIAGPKNRFPKSIMKKYIKIVGDAANNLSHRLGYTGA